MPTTQVTQQPLQQQQEPPPAIGAYWPGQGGIYLGLTRAAEPGGADAHLILATQASPERMPWRDAVAWAAAHTADGHCDFHLPSRDESALIYANGRELVDGSEWHWTSTETTSGSSAWNQSFGNGYQYGDHKSYEGRARAVRRLILQSFNPLEDAS